MFRRVYAANIVYLVSQTLLAEDLFHDVTPEKSIGRHSQMN
jgi:hypothetical protein